MLKVFKDDLKISKRLIIRINGNETSIIRKNVRNVRMEMKNKSKL